MAHIETLAFWPEQVLLASVYTLVAFISFTLNSVTIYILVRCDQISTELNIYLINLSASDLAMSLFCIPYTYTNFVLNRWIFPLALCPIVNFVQACSVFVSVWTLTVIGIDR